MAKRRKNTVDFVEEVAVPEERMITLSDAKVQFLRDVRGLAKQTQRWHKENLNALEKVLGMQGLVIDDCRKLTVSFLKDHFVLYMLEELGLKVNTINGRIRSVRGLIQFLHRENYLPRDYSADLPVLKAEKVIIQAFSEEEIARLLRQPDQSTFTGLRDYTVMLLLLEPGCEFLNSSAFSWRMYISATAMSSFMEKALNSTWCPFRARCGKSCRNT